MYQNLVIIAAFVFIYSIISGKLDKTLLNGAFLFALFGLVMGPFGLDWLHIDMDAEGLSTLAEMTLALVLFTDASNSDLGVLKKSFHMPQRLLLIGLPLTILLGFGTGWLLFGGALTLIEIAILATMLAPTDAALGKAVVSDKAVPSNIRQGLNVESGLNDGICVPILFIFLALATATGAQEGTGMLALKLVSKAIGIGAVVGIGITVIGAWLLKKFADRGWITETWHQIPVIAMAMACYALAQLLGGSGFIACFAGGLLFGGIAKRHKAKLLLAAEGNGDTLALITWVMFGAVVIGKYFGSFTWEVVLYAVLSLTVARMLPVFLVLTGMGLRTNEKLFMGWFGPRGLASIVFAVIVMKENLPGGSIITSTVACTILMSVIAHGISANPMIAILAKKLKESKNLSTSK
jgi:sodium/hydrogen antiporter